MTVGVIDSLRSAVTAAGGTPSGYDTIGLLRQLVSAFGGTPTSYDTITLLRQAITASGGTPSQYDETSLLRALITARGGAPATFDEGALYAQVAAVSVQIYTLTAALPTGATFTRASPGTRTNIAGTIATETNDVARFDYDPTSHAARGLLYEAAATNLVLYSQDLTNAAWSNSAITPSATRMIESNTTAAHRVYPTTNDRVFAVGVPVVVSCIASEVAGSGKRYLGLFLPTTGFAAIVYAVFDLATGSVTAVSGGTAGIEAAPGGWLCWVSGTPTSAITTGREFYYISNTSASASVSYLGDGTSGLNMSEMQFETGSVPTSRIRTTAAGVTRAADVLTLAGTSGTYRFTFDDASTQDAALTASGGVVTAPATLNRPRVTKVAKV